MLWLFDVITMIGTKLVHICEGTVRCPVEWSKVCDLVLCYCLFEYHAVCEYVMLMHAI